MQRFGNFIDGAYRAPSGAGYLDTENPFTGATWGQIADSDAVDVDAAVASARAAFRSGPWAAMTASDRGATLRLLAGMVRDNAHELAEIEVRDNGKTFKEMLNQLRRIPDWYEFYAGLADKIGGEVMPEDRRGHMTYTRQEPLGVIGMITPWNSPLMLLAWKLAPALAAGNTAVLKPSEFTSVSALRFAELACAAGLPKGVLNVVTGTGARAGKALVDHPDVAKLAFTGGIDGGTAVYTSAARRLRPVTLELGGKSPNIIFADADLDQAAKGAVSGIFASGGQSCVAGSRVLVERSVYDEVVRRVVSLAALIRLGDPHAPETDIGPVANRPQYERILRYIALAQEEGAKLAVGGKPADGLGQGLFVQPTVFVDVSNDMRIAQEEVFGPVLCVMPFDDETQALAIANDVSFGLGAGVWTKDLARAHRMAAKIEAGTVWVNTYRLTSPLSPFGGYKMSGLGREGGVDAIKSYLQTKSVCLNLSGEFAYPFAAS